MTSTAHAHAAGHDDNDFVHASDHGPVDLPHATLRGYLKGFFLSIVLTIVPFWLIMGDVHLSKVAIIALILIFGVVQIFVHVVYFLHMNSKSEAGWNLMALVFTMTLVVIVLVGSIWVMFHMDKNMMPMSPQHWDHPRSDVQGEPTDNQHGIGTRMNMGTTQAPAAAQPEAVPIRKISE